MPSVYGYWELPTRFPPIADVMSRDRFKTLRRYFHGNDNSVFVERGKEGYDPLFKFRPTLDALRVNLWKIPQEEKQSIDEQMIPFKGRLYFKQFLKDKPHSWGIKVFCRAGSSGIVYDIEIHTGKRSQPASEIGQTADVVLRLVENVPRHLNFKIFFDNFYTGVPLIVKLASYGIYSIVTIRPNRLKGCLLKSDGELKKMGRGSLDAKVDIEHNIVVTKWYDNKAVHLASSFTGPDHKDTFQRWDKKTKKYEEVTRPNCIAEYNKFMGGVDLCDMLMELYRIDNKGKKWYMSVFYYFFDMCVVNGWLLYRRQLKQSHVAFR